MEPGLRLQMIIKGGKHYYIHELVELACGKKVVPCYFYQTEDGLMAKCLLPSIKARPEIEKFEIKIPHEPAFDSEDFETVSIEQFVKPFSEIDTQAGVYLKDFCNEYMLSV